MEKFFKLKEHGTDIKTEVLAGITTFMTMAYILVMNPVLLSPSGMKWGKVFSATALSSACACLVMGLFANLPFALSAGMGLNAFFTYNVCLGMGYSWQYALTAVFTEGVIFLILTLCNLREIIVNSVPESIKKALGAGIGLFVAYIGLQNANIVVSDQLNLTSLSEAWFTGESLVALIGLVITGVLLAFKVKGALLLGIVATTIAGIPFGITSYAGGSFLPTSPYFCNFAFSQIFSSSKSLVDFIFVMFTFLLCDMFDAVGTLIGCAQGSGIIKEDGSVPNCKQALFADAFGTTVGAMLGTSTVTTYVESSAGVSAGGRTGLTSVTVAVLFVVSLFLEPLFCSIPAAATSPDLIIVGVYMIVPVNQIEWKDMREAIPAFITILFMVCASSIATGLQFGILFWVLLRLFTGRAKEIKGATWVAFVLFVLKICLEVIQLQ